MNEEHKKDLAQLRQRGKELFDLYISWFLDANNNSLSGLSKIEMIHVNSVSNGLRAFDSLGTELRGIRFALEEINESLHTIAACSSMDDT